MSDDRDFTRADRALVDAIRADFQPEPTSPARAAELRRALAARIERGPRPLALRIAVPALATAALASAMLWLALPAATPSAPDTGAVTASSADSDSLVDPDAFASELAERDGYLPADYQELALLIEDSATDR
jgi:hypothetical protein